MDNLKVETRLQHWAIWEVGFSQNKHGWPRETPLYRFQREGFVANENTAKSSSLPWDYPEAEEVNKLFNQLKKEDIEKAIALYVYYVTQIRVKQYAKKAKIDPSTFYKRLRAAKLWFADKLP